MFDHNLDKQDSIEQTSKIYLIELSLWNLKYFIKIIVLKIPTGVGIMSTYKTKMRSTWPPFTSYFNFQSLVAPKLIEHSHGDLFETCQVTCGKKCTILG